jgi:hypothetical protein
VLLKMMIPEMKTAGWIDLNSVGERHDVRLWKALG